MEKLNFDTGVKRYRINGGGVLTFHPGDPNLYARFLEAADRIRQVEKSLEAPQDGLQALCRADGEIKQQLAWVFGPGNDFDAILGGVNLLAVAGNGQRVITNLLQTLMPVLTEGARVCAGQQAEAAAEKARARRQSQC